MESKHSCSIVTMQKISSSRFGMQRPGLENLQNSFKILTTLLSLLASVQDKRDNTTLSHSKMPRDSIVRTMKSNTLSLQRKLDRKKKRPNIKNRTLSIKKKKR